MGNLVEGSSAWNVDVTGLFCGLVLVSSPALNLAVTPWGLTGSSALRFVSNNSSEDSSIGASSLKTGSSIRGFCGSSVRV